MGRELVSYTPLLKSVFNSLSWHSIHIFKKSKQYEMNYSQKSYSHSFFCFSHPWSPSPWPGTCFYQLLKFILHVFSIQHKQLKAEIPNSVLSNTSGHTLSILFCILLFCIYVFFCNIYLCGWNRYLKYQLISDYHFVNSHIIIIILLF